MFCSPRRCCVAGMGAWGMGPAFEVPCPTPVMSKLAAFAANSSGVRYPQRRVWPRAIVILLPLRDLFPRVGQISEPVLVEALVPEAPVEALDVAILHRTSWLDRVPVKSLLVCPLIDGTAEELRPVVRADLPWQPAHVSFQHSHHAHSAEGGIDLDSPGTRACSRPRCSTFRYAFQAVQEVQLWLAASSRKDQPAGFVPLRLQCLQAAYQLCGNGDFSLFVVLGAEPVFRFVSNSDRAAR